MEISGIPDFLLMLNAPVIVVLKWFAGKMLGRYWQRIMKIRSAQKIIFY
jgi:hypothetical protein